MRAAFIVLLMMVNTAAYGSAGSTVIANNHDAPAAFELQDVKGKLHRLADYRGQWVIVNFWASWCGPCIREIPELKRFYQQYRDEGVVVIGINFEELTVEQLEQAIAEFRIDYPVLRIGGIPLVPFEPLKGLPSTFAVSPRGRLVKSWVGPVNGEVLNTFIMKQFKREKS
jgi:thiol-disulfide isomerase/thioredoxin